MCRDDALLGQAEIEIESVRDVSASACACEHRSEEEMGSDACEWNAIQESGV